MPRALTALSVVPHIIVRFPGVLPVLDEAPTPDPRLCAFQRQKHLPSTFAQFIGVCSNAKTCEIGENLLSVSGPISRPQERLIHAGALVRPRTLQRRPVSRLHPYAPVAH